jgi:hypothetical protein
VIAGGWGENWYLMSQDANVDSFREAATWPLSGRCFSAQARRSRPAVKSTDGAEMTGIVRTQQAGRWVAISSDNRYIAVIAARREMGSTKHMKVAKST